MALRIPDLLLFPLFSIRPQFHSTHEPMDDKIAKFDRAVSLSAEEESGAVIHLGLWHSESEPAGFCLVDRLLSHRSIHFDAMRTTLEVAFNPIRGMETKLIEDNRILFRFHHKLDRQRVFDNAPWAYEKNLLVLGMVHEHDSPKRINLDWCEFHVLVHDLPIGKMTKDMAVFLGNQLGRFKDVDMDNSMDLWGASMRIRVSLDITKPLRRVLKLKTTMRDELLITFTYEKLPNFCYICGRLGHLSEACEMQLSEDFVDPGNNTPYGAWLRAPHNAPNRNCIQPSGQLTTGNNRDCPTFISKGCQHNPNGDLSPNQNPSASDQPSSPDHTQPSPPLKLQILHTIPHLTP
ncbi:UNVERIFIED_CONTAM: hypothetical protein Sradi_0464600 [Sesamum radiatum]|uniref:CCHC-type domain-containing protein n=1 Tax=Sesamum radiatum TaxID=300843 RepID=A0AAW2WBE5_SESRA